MHADAFITIVYGGMVALLGVAAAVVVLRARRRARLLEADAENGPDAGP